jgi:hypothetical protein
MESLVEKFKTNPNSLTKEDKYNLVKYFKSERMTWTDIINTFDHICVLRFMTFCNIDVDIDNHNNDMRTNRCYKYYVENENYDKNTYIYLDVVEKYYENVIKLNVDKQLIVSSSRDYKNGYKEGIMIKKEPYNSSYSINVFGLVGGDIDLYEGKIYNTKQVGKIFRFNTLPDLYDLKNSIMIYDLLEKTEGILIHTDITTFKSFDTAKSYKWND